MKTLEQLKAEQSTAFDRWREAEREYSAAKKAVEDFQLQSSGIAGQVASDLFDKEPDLTHLAAIAEPAVHFDWIEGRIVRKDGTLGTKTGYASDLSKARIIGPFEGQKP